VSLSPRSFQAGDFTSFFEQAAQMGDLVRWAGDWTQLDTPGNAAEVVATLASTYGYQPVIALGVYNADQKRLTRPLDEATRADYIQSAVAFVEKYRPPYVSLGAEMNLVYEGAQEEFDQYVSFFEEAYDAIKAASPETVVSVGFQLEHMKGLQGGLFGGTNDPSQGQWGLLERFPKADMVTFTTYPGFIYGDPGEAPSDYYAEIASHTDKPIGFEEIGWPHAVDVPGWESSEEEQGVFVRRFFDLIEGLDVRTAVWLSMYSLPHPNTLFQTMALRRADGSTLPAWDAWVAAE
jgi:hypothetical protein